MTTGTYRLLASGALAWVDPDGTTTLERCSWLVRVASGNPEPDSFADTFRDVDCGELIRSLDGTLDHTTCDAGHERHAAGSAEWLADEAAWAAHERLDEPPWAANTLTHVC